MADLSGVFDQIIKQIAAENHQEVLRLCEARKDYTDSEEGDADLLKTQAIACIHLGKFAAAQELLEGIDSFYFEKAYLEYKRGQFSASLAMCEGSTELRMGVLRAQSVSAT